MEASDEDSSDEEEQYDPNGVFDQYDDAFDQEMPRADGLSLIVEEDEDFFSEASIKSSALRHSIIRLNSVTSENENMIDNEIKMNQVKELKYAIDDLEEKRKIKWVIIVSMSNEDVANECYSYYITSTIENTKN